MAGILHLLRGTGGHRWRRDVADSVVDGARARGWDVQEVALADLASRVSAADRVVVCGGDGLVHQCLPSLTATGVEVAIVPNGSGNDFARAVGIDRRDAVAVATAPPGASVAIAFDAIRAGDRWAASVVTAGFSGRVNATANDMRFPPGSAKYTVAALLEIGRLQPVWSRLVLHGPGGDEGAEPVVIEGELTMFAVGNTGAFGGGMRICPSADPTDGLLDVVTLGPIGRFEFARWLPKVFRGAHVDHDAVDVAQTLGVTIETSEPLWADGEPFGEAPIELRVARRALRLLVR